MMEILKITFGFDPAHISFTTHISGMKYAGVESVENPNEYVFDKPSCDFSDKDKVEYLLLVANHVKNWYEKQGDMESGKFTAKIYNADKNGDYDPIDDLIDALDA